MGDFIKKVKQLIPNNYDTNIKNNNDLFSSMKNISEQYIEKTEIDVDDLNNYSSSNNLQNEKSEIIKNEKVDETIQNDKSTDAKQTDNTKQIKKFTNEDFEKAIEASHSAKLLDELDYNSFINSFSNSKFENLEGFNEFIKSEVNDAGYGTVNGVVAAAMAFAYEYAKETGDKYFYTKNFDITMRGGTDGVVPNVTNLDCRAFVQWALYNGGFNADEITYRENFENWGAENGLVCDDITSAKPGDIFSGGLDGGHIWLVVGNFDGGYYVAEEYGKNNGLVINKYTFEEHAAQVENYGAKLYDMSTYYNNINNVRKDGEKI